MVLKLLKEVLRVGEATLPYPFEPIDLAPGFRGKPQHDPELCIACAACAIACPPNALTMTTDLDLGIQRWSLFVGRCIYCARCEEVCPTGAIKLSQFFEMAVMNKEDLFEHADYHLAACKQCGRYFAPAKELDYTDALLQQSKLPAEQIEFEHKLLRICPECKRKNDIPKLVDVYREAGQ
jgi:hydrogenase-4 component H